MKRGITASRGAVHFSVWTGTSYKELKKRGFVRVGANYDYSLTRKGKKGLRLLRRRAKKK